MNFRNCDGGLVADRIIQVIIENKQRLTDIDGAIGDGDHGINMSKGMHVAEEALKDTTYGMSKGLQVIQEALMNKIGGSMGPLYGMVFKGFVDASKKENVITGEVVKNMLEKALKNLQIITDAAEGDKTLLDVICPSMRVIPRCVPANRSYEACIDSFKACGGCRC